MTRGTTISKLNIELTLDTSDVEQGIKVSVAGMGELDQQTDKLSKSLKDNFDRGVNSAVGHLERFTNMMNATMEIAGRVGNAVQGMLEKFGETQHLQRQADGLRISVERYQELLFAFRAVGADADDLSDALQEVQTKMGMEGDRGLIVFANRMQELGASAEATRLSMEMFGDDLARKLRPLFLQGEENLSRLMARANEVNAVVSEEEIAQGGGAVRAMRELTASMDGLVKKLMLMAGPQVQDALELLVEMAVELGNFVDENGDELKSIFASMRRDMEAMIEPIRWLLKLVGDSGFLKFVAWWGENVGFSGIGQAGRIYETVTGNAPSATSQPTLGTASPSTTSKEAMILEENKQVIKEEEEKLRNKLDETQDAIVAAITASTGLGLGGIAGAGGVVVDVDF